jgi:GNAT superfamily N-acetyltransferase
MALSAGLAHLAAFSAPLAELPHPRLAASAIRQGIGRALVCTAREWAAAHGLANLTLHTGAYNTGAREFCAALGFGAEEVRLTLPL